MRETWILAAGYSVRESTERRWWLTSRSRNPDGTTALLLPRIERRIIGGLDVSERLTVKSYGERWLRSLTARPDMAESARKYKARFEKYIVPALGQIELTEVRPRHVRDFVIGLKNKIGVEKDAMAPRIVHHLYSVLRLLIRDAEVEEFITSSPCKLKPNDLPKEKDKRADFRDMAVFTEDEARVLITDTCIPFDRRVFNALLLLTGARFGEASALTWADYNAEAQLLGELRLAKSFSTTGVRVKSTKTGGTRRVPAHPALAAILAQWKDDGWERKTPASRVWIPLQCYYSLSFHPRKQGFISLRSGSRGVAKEA